MQGMKEFIPTDVKISYINKLLRVGFDTIDMGSFVSPKTVPQTRDTGEVIKGLDLSGSLSKILVIAANDRGIEEASAFEAIDYVGFPLSLSETFQRRNTNRSIEDAFAVIEKGRERLARVSKQMVVYLSMGFGNPYNDPYSPEYIRQFTRRLSAMGIGIVSLSDTIGIATPALITRLFSEVLGEFPEIEFGAHLHSHPATVIEKLEAAYNAGCTRFDSAINGYGGCPMADDDLVGNLATQQVIRFFENKQLAPGLNQDALASAMAEASAIFPLS